MIFQYLRARQERLSSGKALEQAIRDALSDARVVCGGDGNGCEAFRTLYKPPRVWRKCGTCPMDTIWGVVTALEGTKK